jgi:hypothetical protein
MSGRNINPIVIARGEDLGNGFCVVSVDWLPGSLPAVAEKFSLVKRGKCVISAEFIENPWHADAVYSMDFVTRYDQSDL